MKVVLDPGHGGSNIGAYGSISYENDVVMSYALGIYQELSEVFEIDTILTRMTDEYVSLSRRSMIAVEESADLFISLHCNSSPYDAANDLQIYYYKDEDEKFANYLFNMLSMVDGKQSRWSRTEFASFQVLTELSHTNIPAVLIEIGFISNVEDEKLMLSPAFMEDFCKTAAKAIVKYIT